MLKVIDIGAFAAGPYAATLMADFGAEVIKVESIENGDPLRNVGRGTPGLADLWALEGRNKRSVALDWRTEAGRDILMRLLTWADILVENYRPGTLARAGFAYEDVCRVNPGIVYVSVSGYGQYGPYASRGSVEPIASAFSGLTFLTGHPDTPPVRSNVAVCDYMSGTLAAFAAMQAVWSRDASADGIGDHIDLALYEAPVRAAEATVIEYARDGTVRTRTGGAGVLFAPCSNFESRDGVWISLSTPTPASFGRLAELMGDPQLLEIARERGMARHGPDSEYAHRAVTEWIKARPAEEILTVLLERGISASRVNSTADLVADPHLQARKNFVEVADAQGKPLLMQNVIPKFANRPGSIRWTGEPLGASTRAVLTALCDLRDEQIDQLEAEGVVRAPYQSSVPRPDALGRQS